MPYISLLLAVLCIFLLGLLAYWLSLRPSNQRDWVSYQSVMPSVEFKGNKVTIKGVRNFRYKKDESFKENYDDRTYDLSKLESVWFGMVPFGNWQGIAHTFLSFGFKGDKYVCVSPEIRREKGEVFSPFWGMMRQFEFMYVIADEEDVIGLRTNVRSRKVFLYPVKTSVARMRELFVNILRDTNELREHPRFYNTFSNSCSSAIAKQINKVVPGRVPIGWQVWAAGYSDLLAYELGLIDTDLSFLKAKKHFMISNAARSVRKGDDFSKKIRIGL